MLMHAMQPEIAPITDTPVSADSDEALVRAAAAGDIPAFEALYRQYVRRVFAVVWRLVGGVDARAEELTQETFVRAWQALPNFRFESSFVTWLHRLAVNTGLMELRARWSWAFELPTAMPSSIAISSCFQPSTSYRISTARARGGNVATARSRSIPSAVRSPALSSVPMASSSSPPIS